MNRKVLKLLIFIMALTMLFTACTSSNKEASSTNFKEGTYETTAKGYGGDIKLKTTFTTDKIESIEVLEQKETQGIGSVAIEQLPKDIVQYQSLGVDLVAGATVSSTAILEAVKQAVSDAGGDAEALVKVPVEKTKEGKEIKESADVIVIGGGGAGLAAAVSAAQKGASVILIEKTAALGGNTIRAGGPLNAADKERQSREPAADAANMEKVYALSKEESKNEIHKEKIETLKAELKAYEADGANYLFDSPSLHFLQSYAGGDYDANPLLVKLLTEEALPTVKWLASNGVRWTDKLGTVPGGLWARAHYPEGTASQEYINVNSALAEKLGAKIILNTKATELVLTDGKVTGVKAEDTNANTYELTANKGVIIATGGFAANKEMRKKYDQTLSETLGTTNTPAAQGEGIVMAENIGANIIGMEYIQSLPLGDPQTGSLNGWLGYGVENYYQINKDGVRFMAEDGRRDVMTSALLSQPEALSYIICDSNAANFKGEGKNQWGDNIDELVKAGRIFRADTIEDLATQIGVKPETLKETHDTFNSYISNRKDPEFNRTLFGEEINQGPYYASPRKPTVHHTMGGIQINETAQVLDSNGKPIPGLFAAGEVTGGIHGKNRLGGNALLDINLFGKIAGESAAK